MGVTARQTKIEMRKSKTSEKSLRSKRRTVRKLRVNQSYKEGSYHPAYAKGNFDCLGCRILRFVANPKESECCDEW